MLRKVENIQSEYEFITIEELVPQNHLLRVIYKIFDFSFINDILNPFYCKNNGRPAVKPIRIIKLFLIGYLFGIRPERQLCSSS